MSNVADRVKETSTTTGTGTLDLAGAVAGFQTFVLGIGNGLECFYAIEDGTDWEVGRGTVTDAGPDTLSRAEVFASSNAGALVNFSAGTKNVFTTAPAELIQHSLPRQETKATGSMSTGFDVADSPVTLFTVTGDVLILDVIGVTKTPVTSVSNAGELRMGVSGSDSLFIAGVVANGTNLNAVGDVWTGVSAAEVGADLQTDRGWVVSDADVLLSIISQDMTAGDMTFYVRWIPLSSDGDLVAA